MSGPPHTRSRIRSMTDIAPEHDTESGSAASRPLEIALAVVALVFSTSYFFLSTQIVLRREAPPGQIDARFWPLVLGTAAQPHRARTLIASSLVASPA